MIDQTTRETLRTLKEKAGKVVFGGSSFKDIKVLLKKLVNVRCPIEEKFEFICITNILSHRKKTDVHRVTQGLKALENVGRNLLTEENKRRKPWNRISSSGAEYQKLNDIYGFEEILKLFGYDKTYYTWEFSENSQIDRALIARVVFELLLLQFELKAVKTDANFNGSGDNTGVSNLIDKKIEEQLMLFENKIADANFTEKSLLEEVNENSAFDKDDINVSNMETLQSVEKAIDEWEEEEIKLDSENPPASFIAGIVRGIWKRIYSSVDSTPDIPITDNNEPKKPLPDSHPSLIEDLYENLNVVSTSSLDTTIIPQDTSKCDESLQSECDSKSENMVLKQTRRDGQHCDLCGSSTPAVRCEKCANLIFCLSCDDMYHRHPKRRNHARKAVESLKTHVPKGSENDADPNRLPVPPPRRRKSQKSVPSSPLFGRKYSQPNPPLPKKEFSFMDKVGSLRRMIGRPLPPVPKDEPPVRPQKTFSQNESSPFRRLSSSCSSYSNVSDNEAPANDVGYQNFRSRHSPTYANESSQMPDQHPAGWENQSRINTNQTSYPNSLSKADLASGVQLGFQGFPTLPKRGYNNSYPNKTGTMTGDRVGTTSNSSVCDMQNRAAGMQPMNMPQAQSIQDLNYMQQMPQMPNAPPFINPYMSPYPMMPPWMAHPQNYYHPNVFQPVDQLKRTPSNSSMNYPCSESGFRLNSYTSMGHLHNPMAVAPFSPYMPQTQRPPSPTFSSKSARAHKNHNVSGDGSFPRSGRRSTHHGVFHTGRRSILDNSSSEEDYFSASDEEELRSLRTGRSNEKGWQCEHCTLINALTAKICVACCKTRATGRRASGERRRRRRERDGSAKSPSSGGVDSRSSSGLKERRPSSKTPEDEVDDLVNEMDAALNVKSSAEKSMNLSTLPTSVHADGVDAEKNRAEVENGFKSQGNEPQRKVVLEN
uniref:RanBP2-type domain-containing protein n=1 Tax=Strigamia maritima TaxID=126957 RepID=T1J4W9_STRMM